MTLTWPVEPTDVESGVPTNLESSVPTDVETGVPTDVESAVLHLLEAYCRRGNRCSVTPPE